MAKKQGIISRFVIGSEKSEGYARASLPSNRWELFWDIFKGRLGKLALVNMLVFIFCIPLIAVVVFRLFSIAGYGSLGPFSQPFGVGYQAADTFVGYPESIILSVNIRVFAFLPLAMTIAAVGISGGAYVIRNMVWTEGIFVANDFWRGVKQNFFSVLFVLILFSLVFYLSALGIAYDDLAVARGEGSVVLLKISKVLLVIITILFGIMCAHMLSLAVTYKLKLRHLIKNAFLLTMGLLPQSIFFAAIAAIPFLLFLIGVNFFTIIAIILMLFLSFSFALLVWTDFSQWTFDRFINDKVPGATKNRGIYEKVTNSDSESLKKYKEQLELAAKTSLASRPIKPITDEELTLAELPQSFNRNDIERLNQSRKVLYEDNERYIEEHKNDPKYAAMNNQEAEEEKARKTREDKIEKARRELKKRDEESRRRSGKNNKK